MPRPEADRHSPRPNSLISVRAGVSAGQSECTRAPPKRRKETAARFGEVASARMNEEHGQQKPSVLRSLEEPRSRSQEGTKSKLWSALQGAKRHAKSLAGVADAEYRDCSCCGAEREAQCPACKYTLACQPSTLMPNRSLKLSPNGGPPGPVWRYAVHFRQSGPGVPPSVPA